MADAKSAPSVGELVAANYRILGTAGAGGMGVVYRALDVKLQRTVALKFLPPDLNASERDKERFLREARTASALDHPNIGVIYGIEDTADDRSFIAMAFYEGKSLAQRIRAGVLSPAEAADIAIQVLRGLEYAHARGIEHRDVKPSNIMLAQQSLAPVSGYAPTAQQPSSTSLTAAPPTVKIVDFGLAHVSQQTASKTHGLSGTVAYMSPEQTLGRPFDCKADIWATGIVLVEMLTGQNPFSRETIPATVFAILNEPPRLPERPCPPLSELLRDASRSRTDPPRSAGQRRRGPAFARF
jgi:serine/threonine protein kinase